MKNYLRFLIGLCCIPYLEEITICLMLYPVTYKSRQSFLWKGLKVKGKRRKKKKKSLGSKQLLLIAVPGEISLL